MHGILKETINGIGQGRGLKAARKIFLLVYITSAFKSRRLQIRNSSFKGTRLAHISWPYNSHSSRHSKVEGHLDRVVISYAYLFPKYLLHTFPVKSFTFSLGYEIDSFLSLHERILSNRPPFLFIILKCQDWVTEVRNTETEIWYKLCFWYNNNKQIVIKAEAAMSFICDAIMLVLT